MKLVTKELEKIFKRFPFYSQDGKPIDQKKVLCKFFTPWGANTWLVTEAVKDGPGSDKWAFFGLVSLGYEWEFGYFSQSELEKIRGPFGLGIERDQWFENGKITLYDALKSEGNDGAETAEIMRKLDYGEPVPEFWEDEKTMDV